MNTDDILHSKQFVKCELFGTISDISDTNEMVRGKRTRDENVFFDFDFYIINQHNYEKILGKVKVYIPYSKIGATEKNSIFYYHTNKKDWQTALDPVNLRKRAFNKYASISGYLKEEKDTDTDKYTHFMTNLSKIVLYPDHKK